MTATAIQTPPRLDNEPTGGVFCFRSGTLPPGAGVGSGCDLPPPPPAVGAPPSVGPLTARVVHIFSSTVHGSPSAPVLFGRDRELLLPVIAEAFRRATARRVHPDHTPHHSKGTA